MTEEQHARADARICEALAALPEVREARCVLSYLAADASVLAVVFGDA